MIISCLNCYLDLSISLADTITLCIAGFGVCAGLLQYRKAQKWKKSEFIISLIKDFSNNPNVKRAKLLLDWNGADIQILEGEIVSMENSYWEATSKSFSKNCSEKLFFCNNDLLLSALRYHDQQGIPVHYLDEEIIIRLIMDDFFDQLDLFAQHIENKLFQKEDIKMYLEYWLEIIANKNSDRKPLELHNALINYIVKYKFDRLKLLLEKYGYDMKL
jgi:hypothetical protein